jgi:ubiquinone/menaquinone biosynthesis C-methylase UbiE
MDLAAKAKEHKRWSLAAAGWRKHDARLSAYLFPVAERMLERIGLRLGQRVLDIASGTGEPALSVAGRVGGNGWVLGLDFVEEMLATARDKAAQRGLANIEFKRQDGEELDVPPATFDAVTMRFGLMLMADPGSCLRRAHTALKPGGRIALSTWAPAEKNPWAAIPLAVLKRHMALPATAPGAPGLFALSDPQRLRSLLGSAGFRDVKVEEVPVVMANFASGQEYFNFTMELAGTIAQLCSQLAPDKRALVAREIAFDADRHLKNGRLLLPGVALVASAHR